MIERNNTLPLPQSYSYRDYTSRCVLFSSLTLKIKDDELPTEKIVYV